MLGLLLAFFAAISSGVLDFYSKKALFHYNPYLITCSYWILCIPFCLALLPFIEIPELGPGFWPAYIIITCGNVFAFNMYVKALQMGDLSLVVPLKTFTPVFMLATSPVLIGEFPSEIGLVGVFCIVLGGYLMNVCSFHKGVLEPFRALLSDAGARLMLFVAFIWSFTANFDRIGIENSSFWFWVLTANLGLAIGLLLTVLIVCPRELKNIGSDRKTFFVIGGVNILVILFHLSAILYTLIVYVIAVKRIGVLLSAFFGHFFFKEENIRERLFGAAIMVLGVFCIALG